MTEVFVEGTAPTESRRCPARSPPSNVGRPDRVQGLMRSRAASSPRGCAVAIVCAPPAGRARTAATTSRGSRPAVRGGLDDAVAARTPEARAAGRRSRSRGRPVRLGSLDLGAPLVALDRRRSRRRRQGRALRGDPAGGDRDRRGATSSVKELGRVAFAGERRGAGAARRGRHRRSSTATSSSRASRRGRSELRVALARQGAGRRSPARPGFLVCPGERMALVPGRNYFGDAAARVQRALRQRPRRSGRARRCASRASSRDRTSSRSSVERCAAVADGVPARREHYEYKDYGVAFELADVDHDGTPEVIVSGAGAPGDPDAVKVITLGGDDKKGAVPTPVHRRASPGSPSSMATATASPRSSRRCGSSASTRVDLWRLD